MDEKIKANLRWLNLALIFCFMFLFFLPILMKFLDNWIGRLIYTLLVLAALGISVRLRFFLKSLS